MTFIKFCGITPRGRSATAVELGVDAVGLRAVAEQSAIHDPRDRLPAIVGRFLPPSVCR